MSIHKLYPFWVMALWRICFFFMFVYWKEVFDFYFTRYNIYSMQKKIESMDFFLEYIDCFKRR